MISIPFSFAYERSQIADDADFQKFCKENKEWLDDYALYTEIKAANDGKSWSEWEDEYRLRDELALEKFAKENREGILFQKFMQYEFATPVGSPFSSNWNSSGCDQLSALSNAT